VQLIIRESGKDIHLILIYTGNPDDFVQGTVFEISHAELLKADDYEVKDYKRVAADLKSGRRCWIYVAVTQN
jgi:hypothetical protein